MSVKKTDQKILADLYNACDPLLPATAEYYVDCTDVRGGNAFTRQFRSELSKKKGGYLHFLFSGHIGSGKSSELQHLQSKLEEPDAVGKRYFPVLVDAGEYLDVYDVAPTDILLAIVAEVADAFKSRLKISLKESYFGKKFTELREFLSRDVGVNEVELSAGLAKAKLQLLKKDPTARKHVRDALLHQTTSLLEEIDLVFSAARLELLKRQDPLGQPEFSDFVLILDNLEKIRRIAKREEGEDSQRELFINSGPQLNGLEAHVVYTVPLPLVFSHGPQLQRMYGRAPKVLPMIKVRNRHHKPFPDGCERLREMIQKRLGPSPKLDQVFEREALEFLVNYSGGDVRDLMYFVRQSTVETDRLPIDLKVAKRSIRETVGLLSTSIPAAHWPKLAGLERSKDQKIDNNDPDMRKMLEMVTVMEYLNGGSDDDAFEEAAPWYAVNPIVRELPQFKSALAALDARNKPNAVIDDTAND